jgi:hypothetical protein
MRAFLPDKNKTAFQRDTFQHLPMYRCYAWHRAFWGLPVLKKLSGILTQFFCFKGTGLFRWTAEKLLSFKTASKVPLSKQEMRNNSSVSFKFSRAFSFVSPCECTSRMSHEARYHLPRFFNLYGRRKFNEAFMGKIIRVIDGTFAFFCLMLI